MNENATKQDKVVELLIKKQGEMSNSEFAINLGISKVMWGYLKSGERKPGMKFYSAAMRVFPDVIPLCLMVISERPDSNLQA